MLDGRLRHCPGLANMETGGSIGEHLCNALLALKWS